MVCAFFRKTFACVSLAAALCLVSPQLRAGDLPGIDPARLSVAVSHHIEDVPEFRYIREQATKLGVRAYLFGGTAASYANYVKWDELRKNGDSRFPGERFDYDYTSIYRSTQDLDIVVDGPAESAARLEQLLNETFPHFQGNRKAWEVRLLREARGDKEALLDHPDFLKQHTDSGSTGLIEVTEPKAGEPVIRDLKDWRSAKPRFLTDTALGRIHFYFSPNHSETSRFRQGKNPPIIAAIRFLTKAFQYGLAISPEDEAQILKLVKEFDPSRDLKESYARAWIEKNGKKLFTNAIDIESAWNKLERLGLRQKLIALQGDADAVGSLAWLMSREAVRSKPIGQGTGKTAKELDIDIVAHITKDFGAVESITASPLGEANVFASRDHKPGENARYGDGFYTQRGELGDAEGNLNLKFRLKPEARLGSDFTMNGSYIIVKNKAAFEMIPETLKMDMTDYFKSLADGRLLERSEGTLARRLLRRFVNRRRLVTSEQKAQLIEVAENGLSSALQGNPAQIRNRHAMIDCLFEFLGDELPISLIEKAIDTRDLPIHQTLVNHVLSKPGLMRNPRFGELVIRLLDHRPSDDGGAQLERAVILRLLAPLKLSNDALYPIMRKIAEGRHPNSIELLFKEVLKQDRFAMTSESMEIITLAAKHVKWGFPYREFPIVHLPWVSRFNVEQMMAIIREVGAKDSLGAAFERSEHLKTAEDFAKFMERVRPLAETVSMKIYTGSFTQAFVSAFQKTNPSAAQIRRFMGDNIFDESQPSVELLKTLVLDSKTADEWIELLGKRFFIPNGSVQFHFSQNELARFVVDHRGDFFKTKPTVQQFIELVNLFPIHPGSRPFAELMVDGTRLIRTADDTMLYRNRIAPLKRDVRTFPIWKEITEGIEEANQTRPESKPGFLKCLKGWFSPQGKAAL